MSRWVEVVRRHGPTTPRTVDAVWAVGTFVIGALTIQLGLTDLWTDVPLLVESVEPWVRLVPLAAGCLVMLGKRRHPIAALAAGTLVFAVDLSLGGTMAVVLVLLDLIYAAGMFASTRAVDRLRTAVVLLIPAATVATWVGTRSVELAAFMTIQVFALLGTPLWWALAVRRQAELAELAQARADDLARLAELRGADAVRNERARMARDLHDAIAGNLSAIAIHSEAALAVPADDPRAAGRDRRALEAIRAAGVTSLAEMRSMILLLRSGGALDDGAAAPARLREADALLDAARTAGLRVVWDGAPPADLPPLPAAVDQAAYRILQEGLTNAAKHAPGGRARVVVRRERDLLLLSVESDRAVRPARDAGVPGSAAGHAVARASADGGGLGLLTMRERAEALGGRLTAGWVDDVAGRWAVAAELPVGAPA
ncbi:sensor histidine kinase [Actinotalea subterranea]|uniref:sensor histidine kinase n=1 Tax=Actinotalea subterranea TaxID=2607497 RepID=UPI0011ECCEBE|nr:histidine kinase [Actinotalea subterranea]